MRLRRLTVGGFRGFNATKTIEFNADITLIAAPNSYGKTSIIEALEFLIFGQTSKVESADSKEEYKDSYTNRHFASDQVPFVEAECSDNANDLALRAELHGSEIHRFVNGQAVTEWPFAAAAAKAARPFVVQHALKSLLLASPSDRFQGFARLLGLHEIDQLQAALINLCTKPEAQLPARAKELLASVELFEGRLESIKETRAIAKSLAQGSNGLPDAWDRLHKRAIRLIGVNADPDIVSMKLVELRSAAAEKVFAGSVGIKPLPTTENQRAASARDRIERAIAAESRTDYIRLAVADVSVRLRKEVQLLQLGVDLLEDRPAGCPLCEQSLDAATRDRIAQRYAVLIASLGADAEPGVLRSQVAAGLKDLSNSVTAHLALYSAQCSDLVEANTPERSAQINALFGKGHEHELFLVAAAGAAITPVLTQLRQAASEVINAAEVCANAVRTRHEEVSQIELLIDAGMNYLSAADEYARKLSELEPTLADPSRLLEKAVDARAGTAELSLLIEMLNSRSDINRGLRIRDVVTGLKSLRKQVDHTVGQTMEEAFSSELTGNVMNWYSRIRTTSDPDVHFVGFGMERTKTGDFKNRRVKVAAASYGVELASAVSSLSESKLNALGLCVSVATALRAPAPLSSSY